MSESRLREARILAPMVSIPPESARPVPLRPRLKRRKRVATATRTESHSGEKALSADEIRARPATLGVVLILGLALFSMITYVFTELNGLSKELKEHQVRQLEKAAEIQRTLGNLEARLGSPAAPNEGEPKPLAAHIQAASVQPGEQARGAVGRVASKVGQAVANADRQPTPGTERAANPDQSPSTVGEQ